MAEKKNENQVKIPILTKIQNELKVPKNQHNSFGNYNYRSAEDIEAALKPLLAKYGASLFITEDIKAIGDRKYSHQTSGRNASSVNAEGNRFYIVETIHYKDPEQQITVNGFAREGEEKKGMDPSQLTGATSSYAIKYALGKLFLIDDTQDADSMNNNQNSNKGSTRTQTRQQSKSKPSKREQLMKYPLKFNGKSTNMGILLSYYKKGNKLAIDCANKLLGDEKFVFDSLKQMEGVK